MNTQIVQVMISFGKKTVVLTFNKIRLKALYSSKCKIMWFRISLKLEFDL